MKIIKVMFRKAKRNPEILYNLLKSIFFCVWFGQKIKKDFNFFFIITLSSHTMVFKPIYYILIFYCSVIKNENSFLTVDFLWVKKH